MYRRRHLLISIKRLKIHEFNKTLRYLSPQENWIDRFQKIGELQHQANIRSVKAISPLVPAYLALSSLNTGGDITVSIQSFSASLPTAYFAIFTSFIFFVGSISLAHLSTVLSLRAKHSRKVNLPGFSPTVVGLLGGHDEFGLGIPVLFDPFLREKFPTSRVLSLFLLLSLMGIILPFFAFGYFLLDTQIHLVTHGDIPIFQKISASMGGLLVLFSYIFLIAFHLPLPMKKDTETIRWYFLSTISKYSPHPLARRWLDEESGK